VPPQRKKLIGAAVRNPERTRRRILDAALKEFSARGFAGARVGSITRRAKVNKRMLYHYFGDKEGLFRAVLRHKISERKARVYGSPDEFIGSLPKWFGKHCPNAACRSRCTPWCAAAWFAENGSDKDWVRILAWEGLQTADKPVLDEAHRRQSAQQSLAQIRQDQAAGKISPDFAPEHLQLAMVSLSMFPAALPQLVRLIVGRSADDPKFQREYAAFLKQFVGKLRPC
jgi:AcrR family transcriptional regulator